MLTKNKIKIAAVSVILSSRKNSKFVKEHKMKERLASIKIGKVFNNGQ